MAPLVSLAAAAAVVSTNVVDIKKDVANILRLMLSEDERNVADDDDEMEEEIHITHHNHSHNQRASTTTHHQYQYQHNYHHQHHNFYQHNHHYHHQQYGSKKSHRNPLRNLDLDFKFDQTNPENQTEFDENAVETGKFNLYNYLVT
ncbi:hypothetical protein GQX74_006064 [Glossina fuscipes]|nr:hypothetical protein GQX74_006064 [Glossina fuscipes]